MEESLFSIFDRYSNLVVALSEKGDGSMGLSDCSRDEKVIKNRNRFLKKLGINPDLVVSANLVHGNRVEIIDRENAGQTIAKTDGLLTCDKNLFLSITVADCLPIFLYDFEKEIVGLIHGGWQSLAQGILRAALEKLTRVFNAKPENLIAGIGPGISLCHYEVKEDVLEKFKTLPDVYEERNGKIFLDLKKVAMLQLLNLGIKKENIEVNPECTYCLGDKYFSYRRDNPRILQTMMAVIGMRNSNKDLTGIFKRI